MAQQNINYGTVPNDGTGDVYRVAIIKIQNNFTDLYTNKVDKAATIALTGGATGTATALAGATVVIPITGLNMGSATAGTLAVARGGTGTTTSTGTGSTVLSASPTFTGTPLTTTAAAGTNTTQVASMAAVQAAVSGTLGKAITGGAVTLTAAEVSNNLILFTGVLTSNAVITFPNVQRTWAIGNSTTGAFTVTIKGTTAATEELVRGERRTYLIDSAGGMYKADDYTRPVAEGGTGTTTSTGTGSTVLSASPALTGIPTVPTAATATSTTQAASTAFVQAVNSADTGGSATAVALKTGRNFSVAGGATAAAQSFNGTADVVLTVTGLDVSKATAGTLAVARGGTGATTSTGTGSTVLSASPVLTGTPAVPTAAAGTNTTQAASMAAVQEAVTGYLTKAITGGAVTLTEAEVSNTHILFTGTLTSNAVVTFPNVRRIWLVGNVTVGAFTVTIKGVTAATEEAIRGDREFYALDTSGAMGKAAKYVRDVVDGGTGTTTSTGTGSTVLSASPVLTGTPTVPTAATATSTTQAASTAFVQAVNSADTGSSATAVTLKTARTFAITGGATAAAQTFNGGANVALNVTALDMGVASTGTLAVARGGTGTTTSTGTGANVQAVSPAMTGTPTVPTAGIATNNTQAASTAFVKSALATPSASMDYRIGTYNTQQMMSTWGWVNRSHEWGMTLEPNGPLTFHAYDNGTYTKQVFILFKDGSAELKGKLRADGFVNYAVSEAVRQEGEIGSGYAGWTGSTPATVQVNCQVNSAAYMIWRATKQGIRHLAAMHVHAQNTDTSPVMVSLAMSGTDRVSRDNPFVWYGDGDYQVQRNILAGGSITPNSDIRLKNVISRVRNPMAKIRAIEGIIYTRKDIDNGIRYGYSAQSVEAVMPEGIVYTDPVEHQKEFVDDKVRSVDYNGVSVLHNEALVEHDDKLITHTEELAALKEELKALKELVKTLLPQT